MPSYCRTPPGLAGAVAGMLARGFTAILYLPFILLVYECEPATPDLGLEGRMKKMLGLVALLGAIAAAVMFWRRNQDDDEFLDEELE